MPACPAMIIHPKTEKQPCPDSIPGTAAGVAGGSMESPRTLSGDSPARLPRLPRWAAGVHLATACNIGPAAVPRAAGVAPFMARQAGRQARGRQSGGPRIRQGGGNIPWQHPEPATVNGKVLSAPSVAILHSFCPSVPFCPFCTLSAWFRPSVGIRYKKLYFGRFLQCSQCSVISTVLAQRRP